MLLYAVQWLCSKVQDVEECASLLARTHLALWGVVVKSATLYVRPVCMDLSVLQAKL